MKFFKKTVSAILVAVMLLATASLVGFSGAAALSGAEAEFNIRQISAFAGQITVEVDIIRGSFNALDFNFVTTDNVKCVSITGSGNMLCVGNTANASVSIASTDKVSTDKVFTAVFSVPSNEAYFIVGNVSNCMVCETNYSGQINNINVVATISGTITGGGGQVTPSVETPMFSLSRVSQNGNRVEVRVNLVSGKFIDMDFRFSVPSKVVCESITVSDSYKSAVNLSDCTVSVKAEGTPSAGTVINAVFIVPANEAYTIAGNVKSCFVSVVDDEGEEVSCRVYPLVSGKVYGEGPSDGNVSKTEDISMIYKDVKNLAPASIPAGGTVEYKALNPSVVDINSNGVATAKGRGTGTVICKVTDADGYITSYTYNITVTYTLLQWIIKIFLLGWLWY